MKIDVKNKFLGAALLYVFIIIAVYYAYLWRLDAAYLWRDEATTACWAREMVQQESLIPKVWNGQQLIVQGPKGHDFNEDFTPGMQGWLQFYVAALSFKLFGVNTWTARILFVLFGIAGLYILYLIYKQLFTSHLFAILAGVLSMLSLPYIHFSRQGRYYALVLFFSMVIIYEITLWINGKQRHKVTSFIILFVSGAMLLLSNYFTFGLLWTAVICSLLLIRNKSFFPGLLAVTLPLGVMALLLFTNLHGPFISRAEIGNLPYFSNYMTWLSLAYKRINQLFPVLPSFIVGIFLLWKYPKKTTEFRNVAIWFWMIIIITLFLGVLINKSNAFLRYYLYVIPLSLLLMVVYANWIYKIFGVRLALAFFILMYGYHSMTSILNYSEAVTKRQFLNDTSYNEPMVEFLKQNVDKDETVAFIRNEKGMVAYFYIPDLKWVGLLEAQNPYNQKYKSLLPPAMFDDFDGVDWYVVWGMRGLPAKVEIGYELMWSYRYNQKKSRTDGQPGSIQPNQYTITQAEGGVGGDLCYFDFYRRIE